MPPLDKHSSLEIVKALFLGNPGSGKTGALTALVAAGYKVRVFDFDNLLGTLASYVQKTCPDKIGNVAYQTFTDKMKGNENPILMIGGRADVQGFNDGIPTAFVGALKQLNHWKVTDKETGEVEDFGNPGTWGPECVLVIDSLTSMAMSAYRYAKAMNPAAKEGQTHYFSAQQMVMNLLYLLGAEQFKTNVIVIAHIDYKEDHNNITKGFPRSIGSALNTQIAGVFNCVLMAEQIGSKKQIRTNSTGIVDLKNPVAFKVADVLPLETGLADFFKEVTSK